MTPPRREAGATLIEVLVAVLVLSFGMLPLASLISLAVQAPKLASHRNTAINLASSHIDKIRANPAGFEFGSYAKPLTYNGTFNEIAASDCAYPLCTTSSLADMDAAATNSALRRELPAGGMLVTCSSTPCAAGSFGNLWIVWQEPVFNARLDPGNSDNCPVQVTATYINPAPRCLYVRFKP